MLVGFACHGSAPPGFDEGGKAVAGKVASCFDCHAKASGGDYVFSKPAAEPLKLPE
jgi:hypothetical protein